MPTTAKPSSSPLPSLDAFIRRQRLRQWAVAAISVAVFIFLFIADRQGWLLHEAGDWNTYHDRTVRVLRAIDGDTIDIDRADGNKPFTRVRFWGVDAPETAKPQENKLAEPLADEAWALTRKHCEGATVKLRLDPRQSRDRFNRLLAYIELPDGSIMNETLLLTGLARFEPRFPHLHSGRYELLEKQARFDKKGLWTAK